MAELTIDLTYGTALFEAAVETGKTEQIKEESAQLLEIVHEERDLHTFLNAPGIAASEKKQILENIFGGKICQELLNFLFVLIDKGRTLHFEKIIKMYNKLAEKEAGFSYGTVYSVEPLSERQITELEEETSKLFRMNVKLSNETDPRLIGGVKILVEGRMLDASIRKKFDDLASQINLS